MRTYRYVGLFSLLCFSYFALAESDSVKYGEGRRDSGLPVEDDCKIINEALAAAQTGFGASFTLTPLAPNQAWNCKSPVVIGQNNHVIIPAGVKVVNKQKGPVFVLSGNHARLSGDGLVEATTDSCLIQIGDSIRNTLWARVSGLRLRGSDNGTAVCFSGKSTGGGVTYWNKIIDVHAERFDTFTFVPDGVNGQQFHGVDVQRIGKVVYDIEGNEVQILGGSIHFSADVLVHRFAGRINISTGVVAEPGGTSPVSYTHLTLPTILLV